MYKLVPVKFMDFIILLHKELYNKKNKEQLKEQIALEAFNRLTLSFYKYIEIDNLESFLILLGFIFMKNFGGQPDH